MQVSDVVWSPLGFLASNASRFSREDLYPLRTVLMCVLRSSFVLPRSTSSSRPRPCIYLHRGRHPRHFPAHHVGLPSAEGDEAPAPRSRKARGAPPEQHIVTIPLVIPVQQDALQAPLLMSLGAYFRPGAAPDIVHERVRRVVKGHHRHMEAAVIPLASSYGGHGRSWSSGAWRGCSLRRRSAALRPCVRISSPSPPKSVSSAMAAAFY